MMDRLNAALRDSYTIERELGEGGMATVYLAEDLKHHRKVALKVLKPELAAVVGAERFLSEIETTARLQHPNILPLFDSGQADGFLFYVMPYVEGESLRDRLEREKQLPVDDAVRIATEVAEALASAHEQGVIHRDIKPANIMVSQGRPLLADFGIALAVSTAGHRLTETGLSLGTPQYMSPEQATGDQVVGPPSDIYSLGCVLYEMLVGEPPYTGRSAQAILGKVITSEPTSVTEQRRAVPAHVDATVAKALEKVPADRFTSAHDFAAALADEGFRHGATASAGGPASNRVKGLAVAGWAAATVLLGLWATSASEPTAPEIRTLNLAYPEGAGPSEWLELTPDGSALVMADAERADQDFALFVQRLDDGTRVPLANSAGGFDPAASPDGSEVAFGGDGVFVASLASGTVRTVTESASACCLRWAQDGYIYFQPGAADGGGVFRVRAVGGDPEPILEAVGPEQLAYYQPVGDGRRAIVDVFVPGDEEMVNRIDWVDVQTGERHLLTEGRRPFLTEDGYLVFVRGESIYAGLLDTRSMEFVGDPVRMVERVGITGADAMFTLSESGDLVYWIAYGDAEARPIRDLIWIDRAGVVTSVDTAFAREIESVTLAPDGTRAALTVGEVGRTEIWIKDLDEGAAIRVTNYVGMNRRPVWSPDGREVAFITDRDGFRTAYVVPVAGIATPRLLLAHEGKDVDDVQWSADGEWLVYRTGTSGDDRDVYAKRIVGDTATIVVSAEPGVDEVSPTLSPNGRWIAYTSWVTGDPEIWVRPFPDVERGARQVSAEVGGEALWSPTGEELFFRSRPGFSVASMGDADNFRISRQVLFSNSLSRIDILSRSYAYDGDGDRFLMIRELGTRRVPAELILVQNFMDQVRERLEN